MPAASEKRAATERHDAWAGRRIGDRIAMVWGDTSDSGWKLGLRNALTTRATCLDTLRFDSSTIERFLGEVRRKRPPVVFGHAHSVYRLAEHVASTGASIGFRSAITTAMGVSPEERARIESTFGCEVFDRYGCEEVSLIASECEAHEGLHIFAEGLIVEVDDPPVPGGPGRILVTDLTNHAMPIIRYEIGDHGALLDGTCPCGRTLPRLREVAGRTADFLLRPDGVPVFGISILDTFVIHIRGIKQAQLIQDAIDHLVVRVVRDADFTPDTPRELAERILDVFGPDMRHDVEYVDRIAQTAAGKYRFSECRIPGMSAGSRAEPSAPPTPG